MNTPSDEPLIIHWLTTGTVKENYDRLFHYVSERRQQEIQAYPMEDSRLQALGAGYLIARYTGRDEPTYNEALKPLKPDIWFNVAHSKDVIVFTMAKRPVGIDIEYLREAKTKLIPYAFDDSQQKAIHENDDFFKYWTLKEAIGKAQGDGLSGAPLKQIPAREGLTQYLGRTYENRSMKRDGYYLAVSLEDHLPSAIRIEDEIIDL